MSKQHAETGDSSRQSDQWQDPIFLSRALGQLEGVQMVSGENSRQYKISVELVTKQLIAKGMLPEMPVSWLQDHFSKLDTNRDGGIDKNGELGSLSENRTASQLDRLMATLVIAQYSDLKKWHADRKDDFLGLLHHERDAITEEDLTVKMKWYQTAKGLMQAPCGQPGQSLFENLDSLQTVMPPELNTKPSGHDDDKIAKDDFRRFAVEFSRRTNDGKLGGLFNEKKQADCRKPTGLV